MERGERILLYQIHVYYVQLFICTYMTYVHVHPCIVTCLNRCPCQRRKKDQWVKMMLEVEIEMKQITRKLNQHRQ